MLGNGCNCQISEHIPHAVLSQQPWFGAVASLCSIRKRDFIPVTWKKPEAQHTAVYLQFFCYKSTWTLHAGSLAWWSLEMQMELRVSNKFYHCCRFKTETGLRLLVSVSFLVWRTALDAVLQSKVCFEQPERDLELPQGNTCRLRAWIYSGHVHRKQQHFYCLDL